MTEPGSGVGRFHVTDLHVQIRRLPKPVVAMVAGYAIGGGHVLHLVCDLTIAADNARFGQTGPRVGSFDGGFGASILLPTSSARRRPRRSGSCAASTTRSRRSTWASSTPSSRSTRLEEETVQWCREMLALSPFALRLLKASFNASEDGYAGIQQLAHDANLLFYASEEAQEGREAYKEKREPDFSASSRAGPVARRPCASGSWPRARGRCPPRSRRCSSARRWRAAEGDLRVGGVRRRAARARSSSRSGRTSPTTTPTRAAAPTPRTASARCA